MSQLQFPPNGITETQIFLDQWAGIIHDLKDAPAIEDGGVLYSYVEVDADSHRIAAYLANNAIGAGAIVAIGCSRGKDLLVALLGVMKSGAAFILVDLDVAPARLCVQFDAAPVKLILVPDGYVVGDNPALAVEKVVTLGQVRDAAQSLHFEQPQITPQDLAYIIFTSGSTGQPKGVLVSHRGIPNLARHAMTYGIKQGSRVLMFSPVCFDAIIAEIAMTLFAGGCLVAVADHELRDLDSLQNLLCNRLIDVATLPPSLVSLLPVDLPVSLSTLIVAGERCSKEVIANWATKIRLINAYGPSEATVATTVKLCALETSPADIGQAISNVTVRILDEVLEEVPDGELGEIYISGASVALGYLGNPELSNARFVRGQDGDECLSFRTGDFARRNVNGDILFEGRKDDLVKINGNRVELAEIEACAMASRLVRSCHACCVDTGKLGMRIALFVTPSVKVENMRLESELRARISAELPIFFMPACILVLDELPRNPAGKIDRPALITQLEDVTDNGGGAEAMTRQEKNLALIWAQILGRPIENREANFFALGGNSVLAMRLVALMKRSGIQINLKRVFGAPTLAQMACLIKE
ncbi:amino acid adenylation domain-containing protein [Pseudomonas lini]|uniref:non-ribosomal peptide synthetase n=1 Tax=Pseudomonas lini TaxID=163011 RepID=UPI00278843EF|nr:non-ribosomal peptide synthetase [Pseudomonas lini]MDQ0125593.1 amino acid adenylation domain-containing protein [Pseudomonas lini]